MSNVDDSNSVRAVVFRGTQEPLQVETITLDPPKATEVQVRIKAVGLCHTEQHFLKGELPVGMTPMVIGHEASGIVEAVGTDVTDVSIGDHVALLWRPACMTCEPCLSGHHHRCELGARINLGPQRDGTYRRHDAADQDVGAVCMIGAFAERAVVDRASLVVVDRDIPFDVVALASCSVCGGFGAAAHATHIEVGDAVLVVGAGGSGLAAVQAAKLAGAGQIIVADRFAWKLQKAIELGATHTILVEADGTMPADVFAMTGGRGVDHAIVCAPSPQALAEAFRSTVSGGSVVLSALTPLKDSIIPLGAMELQHGNGTTLMGASYGGSSQVLAIPKVLALWKKGSLNIQDLITRRYSLDEVAQGYRDLEAGEILRGVVEFD